MAMKVAPCNCTHQAQDKTLGIGKRWKIQNTKLQWTCTVCGKVN